MGNWQNVGDHQTPQELYGEGTFRARWENNKIIILDSEEEDNAPYANLFIFLTTHLICAHRNPEISPTSVHLENGAFSTVEESEYVQLGLLNCWTPPHMQFI